MRSRRSFLRPLWVLLCAALLALLAGCCVLNEYDGPDQYPDSLWINDAGTLCFITDGSSRDLYGEMDQNGAVQPVVLSLGYMNGAHLYPYQTGGTPLPPEPGDSVQLLWEGDVDYHPPKSFTLEPFRDDEGETLPTGDTLPVTFRRVDCTGEELAAVVPWVVEGPDGDVAAGDLESTPELFTGAVATPKEDFTPGALLELGRRAKEEDRPLRAEPVELKWQRWNEHAPRYLFWFLLNLPLFLLLIPPFKFVRWIVRYVLATAAAKRYMARVYGFPYDACGLARAPDGRAFLLTVRPKAPSVCPAFRLLIWRRLGRWAVLQDDLPLAMLADTLRQRLAPPLQALWGPGATVRLELESRALCTMPREEAFQLSLEQQLELPFEQQQLFLELPEPFDPQTQLDALWQSVETIRAVAPRWNSLFLGRKDAPPDGWLRFRPLARFAEPEDLLCEVEHQRTANPFHRP